MELRKLEVLQLEMPLLEAFETSFGSVKVRKVVLVRVEERGGEEGWGEIAAGEGPWYSYETYETALLVVKKYLAPMLLTAGEVGARDFYKVVARVRGHNIAKSGVEMALWDLEAKLRGMPLYKYIGGAKRRVLSGVSIGIKKTVDRLLAIIGRRLEEGYVRIKLKIKPGWDINVLEAVRKEYPDIALQVDANAAYSLRDISTLLKLDRFSLLMVEQPLHYEDLVDHAVLSRKLRTPVCLDESIRGLHDAKAAYTLGAAEIINVKPGRVGGYAPSLAIHDFCSKVGIGLWVGGMLESGVGRGHLVALATLPHMTYPNDISASSRYWERDIVEPPWELRDGCLEAPQRPGIGVEVDEEALRKYLKKREEITAG